MNPESKEFRPLSVALSSLQHPLHHSFFHQKLVCVHIQMYSTSPSVALHYVNMHKRFEHFLDLAVHKLLD
jgi:hypothetical protein